MKKNKFGDALVLGLKGIIVGFGGIAPGLSGSVLLIIFGLYQKTLEYLGSIFKDFKKKIYFLLPLVMGMVFGVLLFSKFINYMLEYHEMPTRFAFLGLILGTVPMLYKEVKKNGFSKWYYLVMALTFVLGTLMFRANGGGITQITDPTLLHCIVLGIAVAATAIIPGVDPAVLLSSLGLYELYVRSLANLDLAVLLPMVIGVAGGAVVISFGMTFLFKRFYTFVFSIIFGIFLAMIPNMLNDSCVLGWNFKTVISMVVMVVGFAISMYLSNIQKKSEDGSK